MECKKITVYAGADSLVTSAGFSTRENFDSLLAGRTGCRKGAGERYGAGDIPLGLIDRQAFVQVSDVKNPENHTFLENLFIQVIGDVCTAAGIDPGPPDVLIILSSTKGNIEYLKGEGPVDDRVYLGKLAETVGGYFGAAHVPVVISNACISGLSAVIAGSRLIRAGKYNHVIVAGGDTLSRFVVSGFDSFKSLSQEVCRPYDDRRDGLTLGEGCGALLLTSDPNLAGESPVEITGGSVSNDANHISGPSRTGDGLYYSIRNALEESGLDPSEIDFVNGHGTATPYNDEMESKAYLLAGLDDKPLNSLKPYFGHTLGAAGIVELVLCLWQLREGIVCGVPGFETQGTPVPLNVCAEHRPAELNACLKTASGFGGCNAAVVIARAGYAAQLEPGRTMATVTGEYAIEYAGDDFAGFIRQAYRQSGEQNMKFYKMDDLSKLGYVAAAELLRDKGIDLKYASDETGIILYNRCSSLVTDLRHQRIVESEPAEGASPSVFVYTLPNIVAGEICIRQRIQGDNTFFVSEDDSRHFAEEYARLLVENGYLKAAVCGTCEYGEGKAVARLKLIEIQNERQTHGNIDA